MPSVECCTTKISAPQPAMRDKISFIADALDKANELAGFVEDKLFGTCETEGCEKPCPPQNVQNGLDRSENAVKRLVNRLDSINSRL